MTNDLESKIQNHLDKGSKISEGEVRSLMILIRKRLELMEDNKRQLYPILNLFCNWCAHTLIDQSNTGLRVIAKVNDTLVEVKDIQDSFETQSKLTEAIGYVSLRRELINFLEIIGLDSKCLDQKNIYNIWVNILANLIEIIRDVPLAFPSIASLDATKKKIYDNIAKNSISPGGGVIMMQITKVDYPKLGVKKFGELLSLEVRLENGLRIVVPLLLNAHLA